MEFELQYIARIKLADEIGRKYQKTKTAHDRVLRVLVEMEVDKETMDMALLPFVEKLNNIRRQVLELNKVLAKIELI